ncbi:hypothetical protein EDC21_10574 [Thermohydrogenium kirishiense]|nr:hypothetical protein EDC21_10574 [Thermohydrogenium kirishiense]
MIMTNVKISKKYKTIAYWIDKKLKSLAKFYKKIFFFNKN